MAWDTTTDALIDDVDDGPRTLHSHLTAIGNITCASGRAYFVYLGYCRRPVTLARIVTFVAVVADSGTQTAEVGYFSTPSAPNRASQVLTKIAATAALGLTSLKTQTTALSAVIPAGTHLWVAYRGALATTQPTFRGLGYDFLDGSCLTTSGATALTSGTTYTGTVPTDSTSATCPDLRAARD